MEYNIEDQDLISYSLGTASGDLMGKVDLWLGRSEENRIIYSKVSKILAAVDSLGDFKRANTSRAWDKLRTFIDVI